MPSMITTCAREAISALEDGNMEALLNSLLLPPGLETPPPVSRSRRQRSLNSPPLLHGLETQSWQHSCPLSVRIEQPTAISRA